MVVFDIHDLHGIGDDYYAVCTSRNKVIQFDEYDENSILIRSFSFDGYVRGICVVDDVIYVGLSS